MGRRKKKPAASPPARTPPAPPPPAPTPTAPADVVEGVPDRTAAPRLWKYLILALIFVGWVAFLVVCQVTGNP